MRSISLAASLALALSLFITPAQSALPRPASNVRQIDGTGNNLANSQWGSAHSAQLRAAATPSTTGAFYPDDGSGTTFLGGPGSSSSAPNPRDISNALFDAGGISIPSNRGLSSMVWQWGQFLDHDITLTEANQSPSESAPILVNPSDPMSPIIPFQRSNYFPGTGTSSTNPRQQVNSISSYIDASQVYGSDSTRANALRELSGGRLKTSPGNLLPYNTTGLPNDGGPSPTLFVAGDIRANEQVGLTAIHTLFVREHNRLADLLAANHNAWTDDQLYETARKIVGAEMQAITYREFLPALLGTAHPSVPTAQDYNYDTNVNAAISTEFATSIYRFGHSMLTSKLMLPSLDGGTDEWIGLHDAFFTPSFFDGDATGATQRVDQLLKGLTLHMAQETDGKMVDEARNFLFGAPGSGGMDLAALNIQRSRDHGLPSYNEMRATFGLSEVATFAEITSDAALQALLASVYTDVDSIDAWVGGLVEDHVPGASVGPLTWTAMNEQFTRLRDGDRFFFTDDDELMDNPAVAAVIDLDTVSLSQILSWNTSMTGLPANVFVVPEPSTLLLLATAVLALGQKRRLQRW